MIIHIAAFRWHDEVTPEDVTALTVALTTMAAGIPSLRSYLCGENLRLRPSGMDYGVAAIVDDAAALDAYLDSPLHQDVYEKHLGRMIAERSALQLPLAVGELS